MLINLTNGELVVNVGADSSNPISSTGEKRLTMQMSVV